MIVFGKKQMTEQKNLVSNTRKLAQLIVDSKFQIDELNVAKKCFVDYLASAYVSRNEPAVKRLFDTLKNAGPAKLLGQAGTASSYHAALFNGFAAHYNDFDDVQANFRGHPSVVIYSALLALADGTESADRFFEAYIVGVEIAGQIGFQVNPTHKLSGYHTTATLGTIAAAASLAFFKRFSLGQTIDILSFAATQATGLGIEAGTDTKPMHAGLAAQRAVQSYQFVSSQLTTNQDVFNNQTGWVKIVVGQELDLDLIESTWLTPAQIITPGIWFKRHQFCSAAMSGYDAIKQGYLQGINIKNIKQVIFHFRPFGDKVLRYKQPLNGQEGKFSIEYIAWQILTFGDVNDELFDSSVSTEKFQEMSYLFKRVNDLKNIAVDQREILVEFVRTDKSINTIYIDWPQGSPQNPLTMDEIYVKLAHALSIDENELFDILTAGLASKSVAGLLNIIARI